MMYFCTVISSSSSKRVTSRETSFGTQVYVIWVIILNTTYNEPILLPCRKIHRNIRTVLRISHYFYWMELKRLLKTFEVYNELSNGSMQMMLKWLFEYCQPDEKLTRPKALYWMVISSLSPFWLEKNKILNWCQLCLKLLSEQKAT